jgi:transcriptional regulator with PAS, ATPase and Fis domain
VVSATNRDIDQMVSENLFRKDLYFRLGVIKVEIPSLNDRREDIVPIARHFLLEFSRNRMSLGALFLMPLLFLVMFGFIFPSW